MLTPDSGSPSVTLVVAMLNEADTIGACLESILRQTYPADALEVLVYDGGSKDGSRDIARSTLHGRRRSSVRTNPRRTQAAAWNLGIDEATGDIVGIVSGHAEVGEDYVAKVVETLHRTGADMVGGPVRSVAATQVGAAVAIATSTPFGVGGASQHYATVEQEVDTVFMGCCLASTYHQFRFDESMVRNQDDELSYRLRAAGGRIVCNPEIVSSYHVRSTWRSLARQYFAYGLWKVRVAELHPGMIRPRHLIPSALVSAIAVASLLALVAKPGRRLLAGLLGAYLTAVMGAAIRWGRPGGIGTMARLTVAYPILHVSYGTGFIVGVARRLGQNLRRPRREPLDPDR